MLDNQPAQALVLLRDAEADCDHLDPPGMLCLMRWQSLSLVKLGRFREALDLSRIAAESSQSQGSRAHFDALFALHHCLDSLGDFEDALAILLKQLELAEQLGLDEDRARLFLSIGVNYARREEHRRSLIYYEKSYQLQKTQAAGQEALGKALNNIGIANRKLGNLQTSLDAHLESIEYLKAADSGRFLLVSASSNLAQVLTDLKQFEAASAEYARVEKLLESMDQPFYLAETFRCRCEFELLRGDPKAALGFCLRGLHMAEEADSQSDQYRIYLQLADVYEALDQPYEALESFRNYHRINQLVMAENSKRRMQKMRILHEVQQCERENIQLHAALTEATHLRKRLMKQSLEDQLTGLYNRYHLHDVLGKACENSRNRVKPFCVVLCDIDHFKKINDSFGHGVGDKVLQQIGKLFRQSARENDVHCRYGGEEFVLFLPDTDLYGGVEVSERIRQVVETYPWKNLRAGVQVSMSFGVADSSENGDAETLLNLADERLYQAKNRGRNTVVSALLLE